MDDEAMIFEASYCELMIPVYVVSTDQKGVYIDFNDDNGYMVIVDNYSVLAFETSGDLKYLKNLEYTYYSIYDGFLYTDEVGKYIPHEFNLLDESDWDEYSKIKMTKYNKFGSFVQVR